ncbi:MAG: hypothetical protein ACR2JJ_12360 [Sphingomicrobium sp.]
MGKSPRSNRAKSGPSGNVGNLPERVSTTVGDLTGEWVTSYSGWMHVMPKPALGNPPQPPQIAGYEYFPAKPATPESYKQREGYFVFAAMLCLKFSGGKLTGVMHINRGGRAFLKNKLKGTYAVVLNANLNILEGTFTTAHTNTGRIIVENTYSFIMRNEVEIEWLWATGVHRMPHHELGSVLVKEPYRAQVAHGTLRRIA